MKHFAYTLNLREDPRAINEYKEYHRQVWPEVERMQHSLGVTKIRIFLHKRRLFLYLEAEDRYDPAVAAAEYLKDPRIAEWETLMKTNYQEQFADAKPGEWWTAMEEIYALDK